MAVAAAAGMTLRSLEADACCRVDPTGRCDNEVRIHQRGTGRFRQALRRPVAVFDAAAKSVRGAI